MSPRLAPAAFALSFALVALVASGPASASAADASVATEASTEGVAADGVDDAQARDAERADAPELGRLHVEAVLGSQGSETTNGMPSLGVTVGAHFGLFELHGLAEVGTQLFGTDAVTVGLLAGVGHDVGRRWRLSALGEIGEHSYEGVGGELLGSPGVSLRTGYAGARLGVLYGAGDRARFTVGAWLFVRDDFTQTTKSVTYNELFGGTTTKDQRVGDLQLGVQLRLGFETGAF